MTWLVGLMVVIAASFAVLFFSVGTNQRRMLNALAEKCCPKCGARSNEFGSEQIIDAALKLTDPERLLIATRLLETLPAVQGDASEDASGYLAELDRRASDSEPTVPAADLWKQG